MNNEAISTEVMERQSELAMLSILFNLGAASSSNTTSQSADLQNVENLFKEIGLTEPEKISTFRLGS